jgi:hypothetical protein
MHNNFLGKTRSGFPGFRVAACGLARKDKRGSAVIPAKAGIQNFVMHPRKRPLLAVPAGLR